MKVISEMTGGFGNQLFAYACAYALAKEKNADLYINTYMSDNGCTRELGIDKLKIEYKGRITYAYRKGLLSRAFFNKIRRRKAIGLTTKIYKEKKNFNYDPDVRKLEGDVMLSGYWQSDKYFREYAKDLQKLFQPQKMSPKAQEWKEIIRSKKNTVAVHIRRGDYLYSDLNLKMEYFEEAMRQMEQKVGEVTYCFFSDEIDWVKENFGEKEKYLFCSGEEGMGYIDEFFCMAECEHDIISNSSFSWWAAYLNQNQEKVVIAPIVSFWCDDFYPESWITLSAHIEQENKQG